MTALLEGISSIAGMAFLAGVAMMLLRRFRPRGKAVAIIAAAIGVASAGFASHLKDEAARGAGFESYEDKQSAEKAGIIDVDQWKLHRANEAAEKAAVEKEAAAIAEKERIEAEARYAVERAEREKKAEEERIAAEKEKAEKEAVCRMEISCIGERVTPEAITLCSPEIERLARNDFEWTGWSIGRFSRYRWKSRSNGVVTYIGDKIKFQNGFGAWIYHTYECDFDTNTLAVIDVRARAGRLPTN